MSPEKMIELNNIYVVFVATNTFMGRMIRLFTRNQYSHVTITFDPELSKMYSFARYHINSPISGGFVTERPERYLHGNNDVTVKICKLALTQEEYNRINEEITYFQKYGDIMIYNTLNALLSLLGKRLAADNMFTCLEFVTYLLRYPNIIAIRELERRLEDHIVYQGSLRDTAVLEQASTEEDDFFQKRRPIGVAYDTVYHVRKVVGRVLHA